MTRLKFVGGMDAQTDRPMNEFYVPRFNEKVGDSNSHKEYMLIYMLRNACGASKSKE